MGDWDVAGEQPQTTQTAPPDSWSVASKQSTTTGPAFNAPAKLPWWQEALGRLRDAVTGPGAALNETLGKATGAQIASDSAPAAIDKPIVDLTAIRAEDAIPDEWKVARGVTKGVESFGSGLTTPDNAALLAGTWGLGESIPVASKLLSLGFSYQMLKSAFERSPQFVQQVQQGDSEGAAKTLTEIGLTAAAGIASAKHAAGAEATAPVVTDQALHDQAPSQNATSQRPTDDALTEILKTQAPGPKRDAMVADANSRGISVPDIKGSAEQAWEPLAQTADYDRLFDEADKNMRSRQPYPQNAPTGEPQPNNPPSPRKTAPPASVPEEGVPEQVTRVQYARENLARQMEGKSFADLPNPSRLAIDDLIRQGYGQVGEPPELDKSGENDDSALQASDVKQPATSQNSPSNDGEKPEEAAPPAKPERLPQKPVAYGSNTDIRIPGENRSYPAVYAVREASDVYPSHNPFSFEKNPDYYHVNDRNYADTGNAERLVDQENKFDPGYMVNDNPTAENGPPIIDASAGNVLGGNSRAMTLARVRENKPQFADDYRQTLLDQAKRFGIAPQLVERMDNPVLVRQLTGDVDPQRAITDFNKKGTADLTPSERAISDSKRLSPETADFMGRRIDEHGPEGTLAQALEGNGGRDIVNRLVDDGILTTQDKNAVLNRDGSMTPAGKQRVGAMLSGQFFNSARELDETPPEIRAKLDRAVPSVMRTAQRPDWDLMEPTKEAVGLIKDAKARGVPVADIVRQQGLFGGSSYSDDAIAIAKTLEGKPTAVAKSFRQYASDEALSRPGAPMTMGFEPPTREDAFQSAFGDSAKTPDNISPASKTGSAHAALPINDESGAHAARPANRQSGQVAGSGPNLRKSASSQVTLTVPHVATAWARAKDALLKLAAPAARTEGARETSYAMREMGAKLAREDDQAQAALHDARKVFAARKAVDNYGFIDAIEHGGTQKSLADQQIANTMRQMLDSARDAIRAMGTDQLQKFYENYFPHMWKDPKKAQDVMGQFFEKRPLQGSKAFLKQRSLPTFADGLTRGLEPISDNPVDLVLAKLHEMAKFRLAHEAMADPKLGVEYHDVSWKPQPGMKRIEDPIATVFGKPTVTVEESFDKPLMDRLGAFARSIGTNVSRPVRVDGGPRGALGLSKGNDVQAKFGSPEQVLAHEIGHQIEDKFGVSRALAGKPGVAKELNDLAALRHEGMNPSPKYKAYTRTVDEKMANAIATLIYAPERFKETAPKTWDLLRDELHANPATRPLLDIQKSMTLGTNEAEVPVGGMVIRGHYWAPEDRATIINNFLSPGLRGNPIYDTYMAAGNSLNQAQLGVSAFHLGTTAMETMISKDALAVRQAAAGRPFDALKSHLGAIAAPFTSALQGDKLLKEWTRPGTQGGVGAMLADAAIKAGARARQDKFYETGQADKMADAFRRGGWGYAEGVARSPLGLADLASRPLMRAYIPRLKLGVFADLARFEMSRLPQGSTTADAQAALSRAWDSVDNRLGQVTYDNLFWNKIAKDLAMGSVRAVGWSLGSLREGLGGIKDAAVGNSAGEHVTNRSAYLVAGAIRTGIMGALTYYMLTGKAPQRIKDYYFPGGHSMPGFLKDAVNWGSHPIDTAKSKIHPLIPLINDIATNTHDVTLHNGNDLRVPITEEDWKTAQHYIDLGSYGLKDALPISVRNVIKGRMPNEDDVFQFFGMPKAPRAVRDGE